MNFRTDLELIFYKRFQAYIAERKLDSLYSIVHEPNLLNYVDYNSFPKWRPDFLILKGNYPFIVVEVKATHTLEQTFRQGFLTKDYRYLAELIGADYFILTDVNRLHVYEVENSELPLNEVKNSAPPDGFSFDDIFDRLLQENLSEEDINRFKLDIDYWIKKTVSELYMSEERIASLDSAREFILSENIYDNLTYDNNGRFFHFKQNYELGLQDFEHRFFQTLVKSVTEQVICRYTTFESICATVEHKSYRMASHIAMNDRGEVDYVDKYIGHSYTALAKMLLPDIRQLNQSYISSCTTADKEDDLTMYRLYAEDSRGVCLKFSVSNGCQNHNLLVRKISYGQSRTQHVELDALRAIISTIHTKTGARFRFVYFDVWKHFFKSFDYAIEQEVRVLYLHSPGAVPNPVKSGWVTAYPDRILSKYVTFGLQDPNFPLKLQKIILGPNAPEKTVNRNQLELLLYEMGITNVKVEISLIESYRKT